MKLNVPVTIKDVVSVIREAGFECYLVGGAVRDLLLGREPKDYDLCTNALPNQILSLFPVSSEIGKAFGVISIKVNGFSEPVEIATYRKSEVYEEGHKPLSFEFADKLSEDLARRDFTINAIAYEPFTEELVDLFRGIKDLKNKVVKFIGNPIQRITEDPLRMLRAIRFVSKLEFGIDKDSKIAISENVELLDYISIERIQSELNGILLSLNPFNGLMLLKETGVLVKIIPEFSVCIDFDQKNPYHKKDVFGHCVDVVCEIKPTLTRRLAAFFHDIGKPATFKLKNEVKGSFIGHELVSAEITRDILIRLKYSNEIIHVVPAIIAEHMFDFLHSKKKGIKKLLFRLNKNKIDLDDFCDLLFADLQGHPFFFKSYSLSSYYKFQSIIKEIISNKEPYLISHLAVNGNDMTDIGYKDKNIKEILFYLLKEVHAVPESNRKEHLIKIATSLFPKIQK